MRGTAILGQGSPHGQGFPVAKSMFHVKHLATAAPHLSARSPARCEESASPPWEIALAPSSLQPTRSSRSVCKWSRVARNACPFAQTRGSQRALTQLARRTRIPLHPGLQVRNPQGQAHAPPPDQVPNAEILSSPGVQYPGGGGWVVSKERRSRPIYRNPSRCARIPAPNPYPHPLTPNGSSPQHSPNPEDPAHKSGTPPVSPIQPGPTTRTDPNTLSSPDTPTGPETRGPGEIRMRLRRASWVSALCEPLV
jgi:hypothetical protein